MARGEARGSRPIGRQPPSCVDLHSHPRDGPAWWSWSDWRRRRRQCRQCPLHLWRGGRGARAARAALCGAVHIICRPLARLRATAAEAEGVNQGEGLCKCVRPLCAGTIPTPIVRCYAPRPNGPRSLGWTGGAWTTGRRGSTPRIWSAYGVASFPCQPEARLSKLRCVPRGS